MAYRHKREEKIKEYELTLDQYRKEVNTVTFLVTSHIITIGIILSPTKKYLLNFYETRKSLPNLQYDFIELILVLSLIISICFSVGVLLHSVTASLQRKHALKIEKLIHFEILQTSFFCKGKIDTFIEFAPFAISLLLTFATILNYTFVLKYN